MSQIILNEETGHPVPEELQQSSHKSICTPIIITIIISYCCMFLCYYHLESIPDADDQFDIKIDGSGRELLMFKGITIFGKSPSTVSDPVAKASTADSEQFLLDMRGVDQTAMQSQIAANNADPSNGIASLKTVTFSKDDGKEIVVMKLLEAMGKIGMAVYAFLTGDIPGLMVSVSCFHELMELEPSIPSLSATNKMGIQMILQKQ